MRKINIGIPKGIYCYDDEGQCPYWSLREDLPEQENGYCEYLGKSDWDLNEEEGPITWTSQGKISQVTAPHELGISLLWDAVKMCYENMDSEDW